MLLGLLLAAASTKLPAWQATSPPQPAEAPAEAAAMVPVDALLAAIAARDGAAIAASTRPEGAATAVIENADGSRSIRRRGWAELAAGLAAGGAHDQERLTDPAIEIDGGVAMVWSPYLFSIDGRIDHCGVDHFDLVREAGGWKILNLTWSQRTAGCAAPAG